MRTTTAGYAESAHVRLSASKALVRNGKARIAVVHADNTAGTGQKTTIALAGEAKGM